MAQPATAVLSAEDRKSIEATSQRFVERMLARDFDALTELYAQDAILMPPNHPSVQGRAEIRGVLAAFPNITSFAARNVEIDGRGDLAYVRGTYTMVMQADSGEPIEDAGKYLEIRKRKPDGSWPLVVDMFSSDKDPSR